MANSSNKLKQNEFKSFTENKLFNGKLNNSKISNLLKCTLIIDEINCKVRLS